MTAKNTTNAAAHAVNLAVLDGMETRQAAIKALPISERFLKPINYLMANKVTIEWLIRDYLPLESTTMIYGESGAGKTFAVLDMALHIATGKDWQDHKTKQGMVIYIAGEGHTGISKRAAAWAQYHGVNADDMADFLCTSQAVTPTCEAELFTLIDNIDAWVSESGGQPVLIVFDTLARCFEGNENASQDAAAYIKAKDRLKNKYGACVLSVHHTGKDKAQGGRGSSAFKGAWDAEHCLSVCGDGIELTTPKMKEGEPCKAKYFKLAQVTLNDWKDRDGYDVTSAVMVSSSAASIESPKHTLTPNNNIVIHALRELLEKSGDHIDIKGQSVLAVQEERFRAAAYLVLGVEHKAKYFADNVKQLTKKGVIDTHQGYVFLTNF
jgi:hypothetical protein